MDRCTCPSPADAVMIPSEKRPNRLRDHPDPQSRPPSCVAPSIRFSRRRESVSSSTSRCSSSTMDPPTRPERSSAISRPALHPPTREPRDVGRQERRPQGGEGPVRGLPRRRHLAPLEAAETVQILEARPESGVVYGQEIKRSTQDVSVWPGDREAPSGWIVRSLLSNCPVNTSSVLIRQSWEDYDFWLQLACTEQFQFLPGPAVIYQISSSGRFLSSVVTGESAANLRKVVHAA